MNRRSLVAAAAAVSILAAAPFGLAQAQSGYPDKPMRLIVPFPPGGGTDILGRIVADKLTATAGWKVVVENKAGAGGMIGTDAVAKSPADGYTPVLVDVFHTTTPVSTRKMPYDAVKDFTAVSPIARSPLFLVASPAFEPKTMRDLLGWARANPGKLTVAIAGTGSVVTDLVRARSQLQFTTVP